MDLSPFPNAGRSLLAGVLFLASAAAPTAAAADGWTGWTGPGRSTHPVFSLAADPPPAGAVLPPPGAWSRSAAFLLSQGFQHGWVRNPDAPPAWIRELYMDYESSGVQLDAEVGVADGLSLGAELAAAAYYGGVFDNLIEPYHLLFGFPNYMRESFPRDRILIDLPLADGTRLYADGPAWLLQYPLVWCGLRLFEEANAAAALRFGFGLPLPSLGGLNPARGPAVWAAAYLAARPLPWLALNLSAGGSADSRGAQWNARGGLAVELGAGWRLSAEIAALASPADGLIVDDIKYEELSKPNADLLIAFSRSPAYAAPRWRLAVVEDPISHNSADISAYFSVSD